jgi:hypothetical protein
MSFLEQQTARKERIGNSATHFFLSAVFSCVIIRTSPYLFLEQETGTHSSNFDASIAILLIWKRGRPGDMWHKWHLSAQRQRFQDFLDISAEVAMAPPCASSAARQPMVWHWLGAHTQDHWNSHKLRESLGSVEENCRKWLYCKICKYSSVFSQYNYRL